MDALGHKVGRAQKLRQRLGLLPLEVEQEIPGVEDTTDVVDVLLVDGVAAQAGGADGFQDIVAALLQAEGGDVGLGGHGVAGHHIPEVKDVLDPLLLVLGDGALLAAVLHHEADVLLAGGVILGLGLKAQQAQAAVGGQVEQAHHGSEHHADDVHDPQGRLGPAVGLLHGDALGHHLTEGDGEEGDDDGHHHHGHDGKDIGRQGKLQADEKVGQVAGEVLGTEGGAQKAGQGDGHLDGGQKAVGVFHQGQHAGGGLVTVVGHLAQLHRVQGQKGDLRPGKEGVEQDEDHLQQNL